MNRFVELTQLGLSPIGEPPVTNKATVNLRHVVKLERHDKANPPYTAMDMHGGYSIYVIETPGEIMGAETR